MQNTLFFLFLLIFSLHHRTALPQINVYGHIVEEGSGEPIVGAIIFDKYSSDGTTSNSNGYYNLKLSEKGSVSIGFTKLGYLPVEKSLKISKDTLINITMTLSDLEEVVVRGPLSLRRPLGFVNIPVEKLGQIPALMGEPDLFKALSLTPGISLGMEGSSGLYVRGGDPGENLILLDETPVYNPTHLFGLFSVFHPDMVKDLNVIKGGFPARYGGRLSSIIEVNMKEGNKEESQGKASLGLLTSRLALEGPLGEKGMTSYSIGGRVSYLGLIMKPVFELSNTDGFSYIFYDWNAKTHHIIDEKNQLFASFYMGRDIYETREGTKSDYEGFKLKWGNETASIRYKRVMGNELYGNLLMSYTKYSHQINTSNYFENSQGEAEEEFLNSSSSVRDWAWKANFDWFPHLSHTLNFGGEFISHWYAPGILETHLGASGKDIGYRYVNEYALFLEDRWSLFDKFVFTGGLRAALYDVRIKQHRSIEPRLKLSWELSNNLLFEGSFSRMKQFLHLLTSNGIGAPNDVWVPSTENIVPQTSRQWTLGMVKSQPSHGLELTIEGYYKYSTNLIESRPGTNYLFIGEGNWEENVEHGGIGKAYGLEFMLEKPEGRLNGWISYTLSWSDRRFANINDNEWYPFRYDRRHNFAITGNFDINKTWKVSSSFLFSTGHPVTLPEAIIKDPEGGLIPVFTKRNNYRMPNYHRLDLGFVRSWENKKGRNASLALGVYNLYNRTNPMYIDYSYPLFSSLSYREIQIRRKGVLPFLPYINYNFRF